MNQDVNKILDYVGSEWAQIASKDKRKIAVLTEENQRLKAEIEELKKSDDDKDNAKK